MSSTSSSTSSTDQCVQDYVQNIQNDYEEGLKLVTEIQNDEDEYAYDEEQINATIQVAHHHQRVDGEDDVITWTTYTSEAKYSATEIKAAGWVTDANAMQTDEQNCEDELYSMGMDVSDLMSEVKALSAQILTLGQDDQISGADFKTDLQDIVKYMNSIFDAMKQEILVEEDEAIFDACVANGDTSSTEFQEAESGMVSHGYQENSILQNLIYEVMPEDFNQFHQASDNAQADKNNVRWWDEMFGNGSEQEREDAGIIHNANAMMDIITETIESLAPILNNSTPDFQELVMMIDTIEKQVLAILNDVNLSPAEQQQEIMGLFVVVMGLLGLVIQFAAKDKAQNDKEMSDASMNASKTQLVDTQMEQKEFQSNQKYAAAMGKIMKAAEIVGGALMTILAPGIGSALLMAIVTALEASGVMDKLTNALADKLGSKVAAEAIVGALEVAVTLGGGLIADALMKAAEKAAVAAAKTAVETAVDQIVDQTTKNAIEAAKKAGDEAAEDAIEDTSQKIRTVADKAVESAAKKMVNQFFKQNGLQLMLQFCKNAGLDGTSQTIARMTAKAVNQAAEEAAVSAAEGASRLMQIFGKVSGFTAEEDVQLSKLADKAAEDSVAQLTGAEIETGMFSKLFYQAVAEMTDSSAEEVEATMTEFSESGLGKSLSRATWATLYATGSNNLLVDGLAPLLKKQLKLSDEQFQKLVMSFEILQQVMSMIAMVMGSGMAEQVTLEDTPTTFLKIANLLQVGSQGLEAAANYGKFVADEGQARLAVPMAKSQLVSEILATLMNEISKRQQSEQERDTQEANGVAKSTANLAADLHKNADASARALLAAV